jgi:PAS domain S-box-containing protein
VRNGSHGPEAIVNFCLSLFAIWTATVLCLKRVGAERQLYVANQSLEARVRERTGELENAVGSLQREIGARERVQADLEWEKVLLDGLMDAIPDNIYFKDDQGRYLRINRAKAERSGLANPELAIGHTDKDYFTEEHYRHALEDERRVLETGEPLIDREERLVWPDGGISWVSSTKVPLRTRSGRILGTLGVSRDITRHKGVEEALQRERDRLRTLIDNLPDVIFIKDSEYRLVTVNRAFIRQFGAPSEADVLGKTDFDFCPVDLAQSYRSDDERVILRGETLVNREEEILSPELGRISILTTKVPLRDAHGEIVGLVGICRDISERKTTEDALKQSEWLYHSLVDNLPVFVVRKDLEGRITYANESLCQLLGKPLDDVLGKTDYDFFPRELAEKYRSDDRAVIESGKVFSDIEENRSGERNSWFEVRKTPIRDTSGRSVGSQAIFWDVTQRQQALLDLAEAKEAAEAANRAKSEFLANMSHEIRTPMNAIIGMTGLVLDSQLNHQQRDYLDTVRESAESLMGIINDLLDFSKIESGKIELEAEPFDLRAWLGDAMRALAIRADARGLELVYNVDRRVPAVIVGDGLRLRQVIVNLVGNAIKFTERGEVVLDASVIREGQDDLQLLFSVRDTGIGIAPEHREKIFRAFEQADMSTTRRYGGTGLGLAISSRLAELMGGRISVDSELGVGSTFRFTARFGKSEADAASVAAVSTAQLEGVRVLIVDDNATNRRIVAEHCRNWRMIPETAADAESAMKMLLDAFNAGTAYDLVLTDAGMPDVDGFTLCSRINEHAALGSTIIMMLSSFDRDADVARCDDLGVDAYLVKPIKQSDLYDAIARALGALAGEAGSDGAASEELPSVRPLKLLLAEDSLANQKLAVGLLSRWGHTLDIVDNGRQAVLAVQSGRFDAVLMDVQMPEMDGLHATRAIREWERPRGLRIPIIAMTAHAMKGDRERCLESGMDAYVSKPIRPHDIAEALARFFPADGGITTPQVPSTRAAAPPVPAGEGDGSAIDWRLALVATQGDHGLLREVAEVCSTELPMLRGKLGEALARGDAAEVMRLAHTIKGNLRTFGACGIPHAEQLELAGRSGDLQSAPGLLQLLNDDVTRVEQALQDYLQRPAAG